MIVLHFDDDLIIDIRNLTSEFPRLSNKGCFNFIVLYSTAEMSIQINDLISFFKVSIFNTCFCQSKKPKLKFCSCDDLTNFFFDGLFSISYTPYSFELTQLIVHGNFGFIRIQKCVESYYKELIQKIR